MIISVGENLVLIKTHPCGSRIFTVLRLGTDVRIRCSGCQREFNVDRIRLEKMIRRNNA